MKYLAKRTDKDFVILSLTDIHLMDEHWENNTEDAYRIFDATVRSLVKQTNPDLIVITGDISMAGQMIAYRRFGEYIEQFAIPWALTWGNHDQEYGIADVSSVLELYRNCPHFIHEDGDPMLGNGNCLIGITEREKLLHTLFMVDSHSYTDVGGRKEYDKLWPGQLDWYRAEARRIKDLGCTHSTMFMHMPIYAYNDAWKAVQKGECQAAFGVRNEDICSYPLEDHVFALLSEMGITQTVIAGHDHTNSFGVPYEGILLAYGLKTGKPSYSLPELNGGTVLTVDQNGECRVEHLYVPYP